MIGPAVLVCLFTLAVGVAMTHLSQPSSLGGVASGEPLWWYRWQGDAPASHERLSVVRAGRWLWITAMIELLSNAAPPWVMQLSGNAGEVILLAGFVSAESLLNARVVAHSGPPLGVVCGSLLLPLLLPLAFGVLVQNNLQTAQLALARGLSPGVPACVACGKGGYDALGGVSLSDGGRRVAPRRPSRASPA